MVEVATLAGVHASAGEVECMARTQADVANSAVRIFLQRMGAECDKKRGLAPWDKKKHFAEVLEFFGSLCCYCATALSSDSVVDDHLVPMNKTSVGLHAWGIIVPACPECNAKNKPSVESFLIGKAGAQTPERYRRITEFLAKYRYEPDIDDLRDAAEELYAEVGNVSTTLIDTKIARFRPKV